MHYYDMPATHHRRHTVPRRMRGGKRAPSSYNRFVKAQMAKIRGSNVDYKMAMSVIAGKWRKLTPAQKARF